MGDIRIGDLYRKTGEAEKARKAYEGAVAMCANAGFKELRQVAVDRLKELK